MKELSPECDPLLSSWQSIVAAVDEIPFHSIQEPKRKVYPLGVGEVLPQETAGRIRDAVRNAIKVLEIEEKTEPLQSLDNNEVKRLHESLDAILKSRFEWTGEGSVEDAIADAKMDAFLFAARAIVGCECQR